MARSASSSAKASAKKIATVKKTPRPARAAKREIVQKKADVKKLSLTSPSIRRNLLIMAVLIVAIVGVLLYQNKGLFVAATVNGKPISRIAVISSLEKQGGRAALDSMVTEILIQQEAQKQGKSIAQEEIDEELGKIEESVKELGQPLDDLLALQGMTKDQLIQQIRIQKLIEKLLTDQVTVTDEEITQSVNEALLAAVEPISASDEAKLKVDTRAVLIQERVSERFPQWLEELKAKSSIKEFVTY